MQMMSTQNRIREASYATEVGKYCRTLGTDITEHIPASTSDHVLGEYYEALGASVGNIANKRPRLEKQKSTVPDLDHSREIFELDLEPTELAMNEDKFEDRKTPFEGNVSLREWITRPERVIEKVESLHIFKQVLEYLDLAHSQGVLLRNVRPSCFLLSPLHRVAFIGFAASRSSSERSSERSDEKARSAFPVARQCDGTSNSSFESNARGVRVAGGARYTLSRDTTDENHEGFQQQDFCCVDNFQTERLETVDRHVSGTSSKLAWLKDWTDSLSQPVKRPLGVASDIELTKNLESDSLLDLSEDTSRSAANSFPLRQMLLMEQTLYSSPEDLSGGTSSFASDIYSMGVLVFELFCTFSSGLAWSRIMSDLRHRILPPRFLSEYPKEAALCLQLLHPESSSRPKAREVLQCELLSEVGEALAERQAVADIEDRGAEWELLFDFLSRLQHKKQEVTQKLCKDIACLEHDIEEIEKRRCFLKQKGLLRETLKVDESSGCQPIAGDSFGCAGQSCVGDCRQPKCGQLVNNFKQLEQAYFAMRWKVASHLSEREKILSCTGNTIDAPSTRLLGTDICRFNKESIGVKGHDDHIENRLGSFFNNLCKYARYSQFKVKACLSHGDLLNTANMVCSLSFDRDEEYFATAGVSKRIKVFECDSILNEDVDIHYPVIEMTSASKLSSISWNKYIKNHLASSDYDGVVQLWDAHTSQILMKYKEHEKRAWSVDFSHADPTKLASGGDDGFVKIWSINQEASICTMKTKANICCVHFPADSAYCLAFGSADYKIYFYDLRHTRLPLCILGSHNKPVSYVKFLDSTSLISASTDNTLKLWDIGKSNKDGGVQNLCALTYTGHTNEKNFVGLSVADGYIACGSETNEVFVYHKSFPMPVASHKFGSLDPISGQEIEGKSGQFVSSVCWRGKSQTLIAANSIGNIKLLELV